jgi:hypothetical protein
MDNDQRRFCERQAATLLRLADASAHPRLQANLLAMANEWKGMSQILPAGRIEE